MNRGFGPAHNVLVHVSVPDGKITNFKVDSQELYSLMNSDLQSGQLNIWLDRLASNAKIEIFLTGTFSEAASGTISISAASDEGSSIISDVPTLTEELSEYVWQTYDLLVRAKNYAAGLDKVQSISEWLHSWPMYRTLTSKGMVDVVLTGLLIIFFFWTYAGRKSSTALVAGIVIGLLTWLITDSIPWAFLVGLILWFLWRYV